MERLLERIEAAIGPNRDRGELQRDIMRKRGAQIYD
jgi:hypothetical protein